MSKEVWPNLAEMIKNDEEKKKESRKILIENHEIKLLSGKEAVEFSEDHKQKIAEVLSRFSEIDPELAKGFSEFESTNAPEAKYYGVFPANARIIKGSGDKWGIEFFNAGMDMKKSHRISSTEDSDDEGFVDNFSGTLAHEITHGGTHVRIFSDRKFNDEFIHEWREKFGWKEIFPTVKNSETDKWEISKVPAEGWKKNEKGKLQKEDYIVMRNEYTTMPEACVGGKNGYAARVNMTEDICDSVAAYLLNPHILNEDKREFLKNKINEYKQKMKETP